MLGKLRLWDETLCVRCNLAMRIPVIHLLFRGVSRLGDGVIWYVLMLALPLVDGAHGLHATAHMFFTGLVCAATYKWLKSKTSRPRPFQVKNSLVKAGAEPLDPFSFPSGHTLHAVALTLIVIEYYPELAWPLAPFCALVGLSRLVLGLHYPSDVLAGAGLGILIAQTSLWL